MYDFEKRTHLIEELLRKYRKVIIIIMKRIQYSVEFSNSKYTHFPKHFGFLFQKLLWTLFYFLLFTPQIINIMDKQCLKLEKYFLNNNSETKTTTITSYYFI